MRVVQPDPPSVAMLPVEGRTESGIAADTGFTEGYVRFVLKQVCRNQRISGQIALVRRVLSARGLPVR